MRLEQSRFACSGAEQAGALVAEPGYTLVSEVGYMVVLLFFLVGVYLLLRKLEVSFDRDFFYALVPFMLFGGVLRVVEDAGDQIPQDADPILSYPLDTLFISPIIYFTVFAIALSVLIVSLRLEDQVVDSAERTLGGFGVVIIFIPLGYLLTLGLTIEYVDLYPRVLLLTVGLATAISYGLYAGVDRIKPEINNGTGYVGLVVLWAHAIDGVSNVLVSDWAGILKLPHKYSPKHPVNEFIVDLAQSVLPHQIQELIGTAWPFLLIKLGVALGVVWLFDEEFLEESPRYAYVLLGTVVAVGLGPGTRDMVRAALGI